MKLDEFKNEINKYKIEIKDEEIVKLYDFMELLIEENSKYNLTSIKEPKEIILKHFVDSMTIEQFIGNEKKIIDIGTGAGFPGIPLAIKNTEKEFVLLDSLNKRINFLEKIKEKIKLENIGLIYGRAEDFGKNYEYRETFDIAVSRAVASLNVLLEYMMPFVKIGGECICMKGPNFRSELPKDDVLLNELGGKIAEVKEMNIYGMERAIIIVKKEKQTRDIYPRKAGIPSKRPIW